MVYALSAILLGISITFAGYALVTFFRSGKTPLGTVLALLLVTLSVYSGGYAGEILSPTIDAKLFWSAVQYLGIPFIPTCWIVFTARYVDARKLYRRSTVLALLALSAVTVFAAFTDTFLHLRYASVGIDPTGIIPVLSFTRGPIYWIHTAYAFVALTIGSALLVRGLFTTPRYFRAQHLLMLAGTAIPWINYIFYLYGVDFRGIDTVPFSMFLAATCCGLATVRYRMLDVIPIARSIVFETMSDGVIVIDERGRIADFNKSALTVFPELGQNSISADAKKVLARHEILCQNMDARVDSDFPFAVGFGDTSRRYICRVTFIKDPKGTPLGRIVLFKDNTETTRLFERLTELATIDPLTGINNLKSFIDLVRRQISARARDAEPMAIVLLSLDNFKLLNETYGYLAGDEALKHVAVAITSQLRAEDTAARFGGEDFACVLSGANAKVARAIAERMRAAVADNLVDTGDSLQMRVTASFGVYCVGEVSKEENVDALISRAAAALDMAKAAGRNRVAVIGAADAGGLRVTSR